MTISVKIIIDRKIKKGVESDFSQLLDELRKKAISAKGYISGETLRAHDDPHHYVVISTWHNVDDWKNWEKGPKREEIQAKIDKLLARPTKVKIYMNA